MKRYLYDIREVGTRKRMMRLICTDKRGALKAATNTISDYLDEQGYNIIDGGIMQGAHEDKLVAIVEKRGQKTALVYIAVAIGELLLFEPTINDSDYITPEFIKYY